MLFPSEDGSRSIGHGLRQLLVHDVLRKISLFRAPLTSELVLPRMVSSSAITATHAWVANRAVVRRSHVPSASFLSSHARVGSFPLVGMPSTFPFVSFRFVSPRPTAIAIPNICVHTTARSSRMVRPRLDRLRCTLRSRRSWIRVPRADVRCNAIAAASASTKTKNTTCKTRARVRRRVFRRRGRPATPTRSMD